MKDAGSYLKTKKCVNMHPFPLPFAIYSGMLEDVYCIANSIAFTSVCTPGLYNVMRRFIAGLPGVKKLVLDDILGFCKTPEGATPFISSMWTREYVSMLTSYGRISWDVQGDEVSFADSERVHNVKENGWDVVANVTPLHYLHTERLGLMGVDSINANKNTFFILPAGTADKIALTCAYARMYIQRRSLLMRIPAAIVDDHWILVPPQGLRDFPLVPGANVSELDTSLPIVKADNLDREHEKSFFSALYG